MYACVCENVCALKWKYLLYKENNKQTNKMLPNKQ